MLNTTAAVAQAPMAVLAPPGQAPGSGDDGQAFAQALDQAAARQRDSVDDTAEPIARERAGGKTEAPVRERTEATDARATAGPRGTAARKASAAQTVSDAAAESPSTAPGDAVALRQASDDRGLPAERTDAEQTLPDLAAWVSSLPLARPAPSTVAATPAPGADPVARTAAAGTAADDLSAAGTAQVLDALGRAGRTQDAATPHLAGTIASIANRHADARSTRAAQTAPMEAAAVGKETAADIDTTVQAFSVAREPSTTPRPGLDAGMALAAVPGSWAGTPSRSLDQGAPVQAELRALVGSNEFAPALGSQLSVMVRDGVEHAQLKLNPAEMGPIEVRISLDGTQAQVDFSAAHAATRQALQDAVPALASALRENGLTLTGGGVFEQAREQRGDARQDGSRRASGAPGGPLDGAAGASPAPRMPRARGVVDLYA
jgi:flagellar hook-length control protein FliK